MNRQGVSHGTPLLKPRTMRTSKTELIKKWLESGNQITQVLAHEKFGTTRLSSIIYSLRYNYGMNIITDNITVKDRFGNDCHVASYLMR